MTDSATPDTLVHLRAAGVSVVVDLTGGTLPRVLHWGSDLGDLDAAALHAARLGWRPVAHGFPVDGEVEIAVLPQESAGFLGTPGLVGQPGRAGLLDELRRPHPRRRHGRRRDPTAHGPGGRRRRAAEPRARAGADGAGTRPAARHADQRRRRGLRRRRAAAHAAGPGRRRPSCSTWPAGGPRAQPAAARRSRIGSRLRENRRGRTGHDAPLVLVAGTPGFGFRTGEVWARARRRGAATTARSPSGAATGDGRARRRRAAAARRGAARARARTYTTPVGLRVATGVGLDALPAAFHAWLRARPAHPPQPPRPVMLNTWEAVYFDHDLDRLHGARRRAPPRSGAERFVLDDGWFRGRRDDNAGLGDWYVDDDVWPDGLHPLVDHVPGSGMQFGLWVEPEMVNPDSDLARAHPDWILARRRPAAAAWPGTSRCSTSATPRPTPTSSSGSTRC